MTSDAGRAARAPRRHVDGVLLLDKPTGLSSNAALQRAKRLYAADKAGHTGTLDPLASGLLPVCFGEATKYAQTLLDARKEYVATVRFGVATDTADAEGAPVAEKPVDFSRPELEAALPRFVGRIMQVPPRHSALKHRGRSYYDYARAGVEIERTPREVEIDAIELVDWALPLATLRVRCGKGTYIRTLAEDLGAALGSSAHLAALRRTASGPFRLIDAVTLAEIEDVDDSAREARLLSVDSLIVAMPRLDVDAAVAVQLGQGKTIDAAAHASGRYRCYAGARFIGTVEIADGLLRVRRLVRTD